MQLQRSCFSQSDIEKFGTGAGVIPISYSPQGEFYLLLGRERFLPQWRGSCRWSGFEGSRKTLETLRTTAAREFTEESMGVVFGNSDVATGILQRKDFWVRVVLRISNEKKAERYHATYVVPIEWNDSLPEKFSEVRVNVERIDRLAREMERAFPVFALISKTKVELGDVIIDENGGVQLHRYVVGATQREGEPGTKEAFLRGCVEVHEEEVEKSGDESGGIVWEEADGGAQRLSLPKSHPYASTIVKWDSIRKQIEKENIICHPCVLARRGEVFASIQDLRVMTDFLEKDEVRWWSATDLRRVLDGRGFLGNDCFRPYFLPVLQTILHELSSSPPPIPMKAR